LQVPKEGLTSKGATPTDPLDAKSVIGVWASASRRKATVRDVDGPHDDDDDDDDDHDGHRVHHAGPWVQVSRLGNPLINEVIIPLGKKDLWNSRHPKRDARFVQYYNTPELAQLLPVLYPGVFPNLAALNASGAPRADLVAILLTGIPAGVVPGFQNFTGPTMADMLRLNVAIPPASAPSPLGLIGGDPAGFPNGRRVFDDTVAIELRAVAGAVYSLVDPGFTPDGAAALLTDGTSNDVPYLSAFPYLGHPHEGYEHSHD
jgi:hypothetical protein